MHGTCQANFHDEYQGFGSASPSCGRAPVNEVDGIAGDYVRTRVAGTKKESPSRDGLSSAICVGCDQTRRRRRTSPIASNPRPSSDSVVGSGTALVRVYEPVPVAPLPHLNRLQSRMVHRAL